jgi:anti-anti-sigma factor
MTDAQPQAGSTAARAVVTLPAEIDVSNADRIGEDLQAAFARGFAMVVADMTATTFCDARAIRALLLADTQAVARGAELRVVVPSARVLRLLAILELDCWFAIYPSLQDALAAAPAPNT